MSRIILIILLIGIVLIQIPGEKVPINEGTMGHGLFFRQVAIEFVDVIDRDSYNIWQLQHIMPFALVHVIYVVLGFELEPDTLMSGMLILNLLFLGLTVYWFFRITKKLRLSNELEALAFVLVFFNFFVLKDTWYHPFTTEMAAMMIGMGQVNYFVRYEKSKLFLVSLVGAFVSPFLLPVGLCLWVFPGDKLELYPEQKPKTAFPVITTFLLMFLLIGLANWAGVLDGSWSEISWFFLSLVSMMIFLLWVMMQNTVDWVKSWKMLSHKLKPVKIMSFFGVLLAASLLLFLLSGSNSNVSLRSLFQAFIKGLLNYPLDFITGHLMYYGLLVVTALVFMSRIIKEAALLGIGFTLAMVLLMFFALHPNSTTMVPFLPLLVLALVKGIRRYKLQWKEVLIAGGINLLLSMFWVRINVPGVEEAMLEGMKDSFPVQRYWMHFGHAQSLPVYGVVLVIGMVLFWGVEMRKRRYVRL